MSIRLTRKSGSSTRPPAHQRGRKAEALAAAYLARQGLQLRERNYRCRYGEADLILKSRDTLVFVEVRFRSHPEFGGGLESVGKTKQRRLIRTACHYQQQQRCGHLPARLDVIALAPSPASDTLSGHMQTNDAEDTDQHDSAKLVLIREERTLMLPAPLVWLRFGDRDYQLMWVRNAIET